MLFRSVSMRTARLLAGLFALTTFVLAAALAGSWLYVYSYVSREGTPPPPPLLQTLRPVAGAVSPLQVNYKLELPGRGEIFPALQPFTFTPASGYQRIQIPLSALTKDTGDAWSASDAQTFDLEQFDVGAPWSNGDSVRIDDVTLHW